MLEMNVINVQDIDLEINKLAAKLYDPNLQRWFKRVPRYWLINIDQMQGPYESPAVPRDERRGSRYYQEPFSRSDLLWPSWRGEQPENKPNVCPRCKGEKGTVDEQTGEFKRCKACQGTGLGEKPYAGGIKAESLLAYYLEAKQKLEPDLPGYDPKKRTYTTLLHVNPETIECTKCNGSGKLGANTCPQCGGSGETRQRIARDIQQSFTRFKPNKAKAREIYGGPPAKNELEPWMQTPDASKKELYHFDPIQVRRRDLFNRLQMLVHYLNFSTQAAQRDSALKPEEADGLTPEEQAEIVGMRNKQKQEARVVLKQLSLMKTEDLVTFRELLLKSEDFEYNLKAHPEYFKIIKSGRVIARHNNLVLRRCDDVENTLACARKATFSGKPATWCLKNEYNAKNYVNQGPVFYAERDGLAYVGIHPATEQVKDTDNMPVEHFSNQDQEELAQLLVNVPEITEEDLKPEARHLSDLVGNLRHERKHSAR
jgi:hypothetical protein